MPVTVKTKTDLGDALKKSMERAEKAMEKKNYGYASQILQEVLKAEPGLNEARLLLRQVQLEAIGYTASSMRRLKAAVKGFFPVFVTGPMQLKKENYPAALEKAEKALAVDPTYLPSLMFFRKVAEAAGLQEIAVNAMEIAVRFNPNSVAALQALAKAYQDIGEATKAVSILQKVRQLKPNNLAAANDLKHATALAAMEKGRWEDADSYKDVMRDQEKAEDLEQGERITVRDPEARRRLIEKTKAALKETPDKVDLHKRLASLLEQNHDYDEAIQVYNKVTELTGTFDPGIDARISECVKQSYNQNISKAEEEGRDKQEIESMIQERDEDLLERLCKRVEKFPNELNFRFELGELLWQLGRIDEALEEFQQTQNNAHLGPKSHIYMGKCFSRKGLYDLAIEQFDLARKNKDRLAGKDYKDILYESGVAYEAKGDAEDAIRLFKELYSLDVKYLDVADRMEKIYKSDSEIYSE